MLIFFVKRMERGKDSGLHPNDMCWSWNEYPECFKVPARCYYATASEMMEGHRGRGAHSGGQPNGSRRGKACTSKEVVHFFANSHESEPWSWLRRPTSALIHSSQEFISKIIRTTQPSPWSSCLSLSLQLLLLFLLNLSIDLGTFARLVTVHLCLFKELVLCWQVLKSEWSLTGRVGSFFNCLVSSLSGSSSPRRCTKVSVSYLLKTLKSNIPSLRELTCWQWISHPLEERCQ